MKTRIFDLPEFKDKSDYVIAAAIGMNHWTVGRIRNGRNGPGNDFIRAVEEWGAQHGYAADDLFYLPPRDDPDAPVPKVSGAVGAGL